MTGKQKPPSHEPFGATNPVVIWLIRLVAAAVICIGGYCLVMTLSGGFPRDGKWGIGGVIAFILSYGAACLSYLVGEYRNYRAKKAHKARTGSAT